MNPSIMSEAYCIYLRKSRADIEAEARGDGETLKRHEAALLELARKLRLNVTHIYREVVSGETISSRPEMQQLLNDVSQGLWAGVLVMEVERLARGDTIDQGIVSQTFKYSNTKIITPLKIFDPNNEYDEEYFEFGLFMSRREYKTINRRLQRGRLASVKEGKYVGNKPPYGYNRVKLEKEKGYTLVENPEQANIVRMIFELYTRGELQPDGTFKRLGVSLIIRKLNDLHIPPAKGDVWVPATIQGMLRNPVYIGKIRWNARPTVKKMLDGQMKKTRPRAKDFTLVDGLHKPLIDMDTWNLAQYYLSQNPSKPVPLKYSTKNPLSGLIVCGVCGRRMVRRPYSSGQADTLLCTNTACNNVSSQLSYVETSLIKSLADWLKQYKVTLEASSSAPKFQEDVRTKALISMENELNKLEKQINNIHDLLEQGVYTVEKFLERSKTLNERITSLKKDREALKEAIASAEQREKSKKEFIPKVERVLDVYWSTEDPALRNELLKEILEKAVYIKTVNGRWHGKPDDFELTLFPRLPK